MEPQIIHIEQNGTHYNSTPNHNHEIDPGIIVQANYFWLRPVFLWAAHACTTTSFHCIADILLHVQKLTDNKLFCHAEPEPFAICEGNQE